MNTRKWIVAGIVMGALGIQARVMADEAVVVDDTRPPTQVKRYRLNDDPFPSNQLSLDMFGTYASRNRLGNSTHNPGGGVGLDYFFTPNLGIGADTYIEEWKWPYRVNGSAIVRLPLPGPFSKLAVYGLGGGGREFKNVPQYTWHGGGGAEFKLNRNVGIFGDVREVFPDRTPNYTYIRGGLTFGF